MARRVASGPIHVGDVASGEAYSFALTLPEDALPGYRSGHGELYWELHVRSDELGRDTHERRRVEVVPSGG